MAKAQEEVSGNLSGTCLPMRRTWDAGEIVTCSLAGLPSWLRRHGQGPGRGFRKFERELPADSALAEVIRVRRKIHKPGTSPMFSCGTLTLERCPSKRWLTTTILSRESQCTSHTARCIAKPGIVRPGNLAHSFSSQNIPRERGLSRRAF